MDVLRNQSGITKKTFRFGADGVQLISKAIIDTNIDSKTLLGIKTLTNKTADVLTSNLSERDLHALDKTDPDAQLSLYDLEFNKSEIVSYSVNQGEGVITLWVKGGYVKLPLSVDLSTIQDANKDSVIGSESSVVGHVPWYTATNGKKIADSGLGIVNRITEKSSEELQEYQGDDDGTGNTDNLVTENAVLDFIGIPKNYLLARLHGELPPEANPYNPYGND